MSQALLVSVLVSPRSAKPRLMRREGRLRELGVVANKLVASTSLADTVQCCNSDVAAAHSSWFVRIPRTAVLAQPHYRSPIQLNLYLVALSLAYQFGRTPIFAYTCEECVNESAIALEWWWT